MKIRPEHLHHFTSEGGRPQRKRQDTKKKGRIYVDEDDFPVKKKDNWIGKNKRERNRH